MEQTKLDELELKRKKLEEMALAIADNSKMEKLVDENARIRNEYSRRLVFRKNQYIIDTPLINSYRRI